MIGIEFEFFSQYNIYTLKNKFRKYLYKYMDKIIYWDIEDEWYSNMREFKFTIQKEDIDIVEKIIKKITIKIGIYNNYLCYKNIQKKYGGIRGVHIHLFGKEYVNKKINYDNLFLKYIDYKCNNFENIFNNINNIKGKKREDIINILMYELYRLIGGHQILVNFFYNKGIIYEDEIENEYGEYETKYYLSNEFEELYKKNNISFQYGIGFGINNEKYNPVLKRNVMHSQDEDKQSIELRFLDTTDLYSFKEFFTYLTKEINNKDNIETIPDYVYKKKIYESFEKIINLLEKIYKYKNEHNYYLKKTFINIKKILNEFTQKKKKNIL